MKNNNGVWVLNTFDKVLLWMSAIISPITVLFNLADDSVGVPLFFVAMSVIAMIAVIDAHTNSYTIKNGLSKFAYGYAWVACTLFTIGFLIGFFEILMSEL